MLRRVLLLLVALAFAGSPAARAQAKPDFSGTWTFASSAPAGYAGSAGWGIPAPTMVIKQSATEISVDSGQYGGPMKVVYKLDGSDTIWEAPATSQSGATTIVKWR